MSIWPTATCCASKHPPATKPTIILFIIIFDPYLVSRFNLFTSLAA
jgi:hypothetical protein